MRVTLRPLTEQRVVITGASSGIGLATAHRAAAAGASVALIARNGEALAAIAEEIEGKGGRAIVIPADVGNRDEVEAAATATIAAFGGIDTWVNDAGVDLWGRLVDTSEADHRRLFETNYWGVVHGSLVAVDHLRARGGALINIGSVESDRAFPLQGAYAASKQAVRGFTDTLRMELEERRLPISVTLVKPGSVGTPLPDHAKTYLDRAPRLPKPVYDPGEAARAILHAAEHPARDIFVGGQARLVSLAARFPRTLDLVSERFFFEAQLSDRAAVGRRENLHQPSSGGRVYGQHTGRLSRSWYTRLVQRPPAGRALVALGGVVIAATLYRARR